jgi:hypothetical protein
MVDLVVITAAVAHWQQIVHAARFSSLQSGAKALYISVDEFFF